MDEPKFGERVISAEEIWLRMFPEETGFAQEWAHTQRLHELKGLIVGQAGEVEGQLDQILSLLQSESKRLTAGQALKSIEKLLPEAVRKAFSDELRTLEGAISRRNRIVHDLIQVGYVWADYATGGGEQVPVISLLGSELCDETDLTRDLAQQQIALEVAVRLVVAIQEALEEEHKDSDQPKPQDSQDLN